MTIRSDPPGAQVVIDDQEIGLTPVSTYFTYYGTRKIKLVKPGFETATALETVRPPWYQIPPLDLITDNFAGRELRDERVIQFQLQPQRVVSNPELLGRASALRDGASQGIVTPGSLVPEDVLVPRVVNPEQVDPGQIDGDLPLWSPQNALPGPR